MRRLIPVSALAMVAAVAVTLASSLSPVSADRDGDRNASRCDSSSSARDHGSVGRGRQLNVIGLTADQRLICFRENKPGDASDIGQVTGLVGDASLVGIDFRPANNTLYGVGNAGGIYTIDTRTAVATKVAAYTTAPSGTSFGVDVNPAADALRLVSDTGQNLRFSFVSGATTVDVPLSYPPNAATGVTGAAYTNNDADAGTATTLYDIDTTLDQVALQSPANSGQLAATGKLGVDTATAVGFDIYSTVRGGTTVDVEGYASLTVGGQSSFYSITLFTGKATLEGTFKATNQLIGIAIPLNQL